LDQVYANDKKVARKTVGATRGGAKTGSQDLVKQKKLLGQTPGCTPQALLTKRERSKKCVRGNSKDKGNVWLGRLGFFAAKKRGAGKHGEGVKQKVVSTKPSCRKC